jgi:hypothetical protein
MVAPPGVPSPASAFPARESALPSSGFFAARRASVPHTGERRRSGEHSTRPVHSHSMHQGNTGSGGGKVRPW